MSDSFATPWTVACHAPLQEEDFSGKNTGVGCHFLLQGIFPTQGLNPHLLYWQVDSLLLSQLGSPKNTDMKGFYYRFQFSSVQFSRSVVSDSLRPHESHLANAKDDFWVQYCFWLLIYCSTILKKNLTTTKFPLDCFQGQLINLSKIFYLIIAKHKISNTLLNKFCNFFCTKGKE